MIHFERRGGAKILPNYVWILNEDAREKLGGGGGSQPENYFGRKTKVLRYANDAEVDFELTTEAGQKINDRYYENK